MTCRASDESCRTCDFVCWYLVHSIVPYTFPARYVTATVRSSQGSIIDAKQAMGAGGARNSNGDLELRSTGSEQTGHQAAHSEAAHSSREVVQSETAPMPQVAASDLMQDCALATAGLAAQLATERRHCREPPVPLTCDPQDCEVIAGLAAQLASDCRLGREPAPVPFTSEVEDCEVIAGLAEQLALECRETVCLKAALTLARAAVGQAAQVLDQHIYRYSHICLYRYCTLYEHAYLGVPLPLVPAPAVWHFTAL